MPGNTFQSKLIDDFAAKLVDRIYRSHPGHARDFAWYRGQRPSPARVVKM